jgi:hypothetical protein
MTGFIPGQTFLKKKRHMPDFINKASKGSDTTNQSGQRKVQVISYYNPVKIKLQITSRRQGAQGDVARGPIL